jgi:guanine nucleotide-binding protein G(I)/G(S)/G(T) subunit beta-1
VNSVRFFPNGQLIGTGSEDQTCSLFDMRANQTLITYQDESNVKEPVTSLSFSKSGRLMFTSYEDKKIIVWDTLTAKVAQTLSGHENSVSHVQVSPDGCAIVSGSWDTTLRIWAV